MNRWITNFLQLFTFHNGGPNITIGANSNLTNSIFNVNSQFNASNISQTSNGSTEPLPSKNDPSKHPQMSKPQVNAPQTENNAKKFYVKIIAVFVVCGGFFWYLLLIDSLNDTSSLSTTLTFTHLWTIANFAYLYDEKCQWKWEVDSDWFSVPENENLQFSLKIWPRWKGNDCEEYLVVGLVTNEIPDMWEGKVTLKEKWCIVDEEGKKLWCKESQESEVFKNRMKGDGGEYLPVEKLLNSSTGYLKGGTLRVLYEMTLHSPEAIFNIPDSVHTFSSTSIPSSVSTLSHSFTIAHFKWLSEDKTKQMPLKVESRYFAPEREDIGQMRIEFYPKGDTGNDEENVEIAIRNENTDSLLLHVESFLIDANGDKFFQIECTTQICQKFGRFDSFPRRTLLSLLDSLPTDELTINYFVTVLGKGEEQEKAPSPTTPTSATPTSTHLDLALFTYHYVTYTWTIEGFLSQLHRHSIESKVLYPSTDSRYQFYLRLYPNKNTEIGKLELHFVSPYSIEESTVNWRHSVVDTKGNDWNARYKTKLISKPAKFGLEEFLSHRTLSTFASLLLPEGKLTIKCELWIHEPRKELPPELRNPKAKDSVASL